MTSPAAPSTIVSLLVSKFKWNVDDCDAARLMAELYKAHVGDTIPVYLQPELHAASLTSVPFVADYGLLCQRTHQGPFRSRVCEMYKRLSNWSLKSTKKRVGIDYTLPVHFFLADLCNFLEKLSGYTGLEKEHEKDVMGRIRFLEEVEKAVSYHIDIHLRNIKNVIKGSDDCDRTFRGLMFWIISYLEEVAREIRVLREIRGAEERLISMHTRMFRVTGLIANYLHRASCDTKVAKDISLVIEYQQLSEYPVLKSLLQDECVWKLVVPTFDFPSKVDEQQQQEPQTHSCVASLKSFAKSASELNTMITLAKKGGDILVFHLCNSDKKVQGFLECIKELKKALHELNEDQRKRYRSKNQRKAWYENFSQAGYQEAVSALQQLESEVNEFRIVANSMTFVQRWNQLQKARSDLEEASIYAFGSCTIESELARASHAFGEKNPEFVDTFSVDLWSAMANKYLSEGKRGDLFILTMPTSKAIFRGVRDLEKLTKVWAQWKTASLKHLLIPVNDSQLWYLFVVDLAKKDVVCLNFVEVNHEVWLEALNNQLAELKFGKEADQETREALSARILSLAGNRRPKIVEEEGDGNCGFHGLARQILGDPLKHNEIRKSCIAEFREKTSLYCDGKTRGDWDAYVKSHEKALTETETNTWADDYVFKAVASRYDVRINALNSSVGDLVESSTSTSAASMKEIFLIYWDRRHFDSVLFEERNKFVESKKEFLFAFLKKFTRDEKGDWNLTFEEFPQQKDSDGGVFCIEFMRAFIIHGCTDATKLKEHEVLTDRQRVVRELEAKDWQKMELNVQAALKPNDKPSGEMELNVQAITVAAPKPNDKPPGTAGTEASGIYARFTNFCSNFLADLKDGIN